MHLACKLCRAPSRPIYVIRQGGDRCNLLECASCGFRFTDYIDRPEIAPPATAQSLAKFAAYVAAMEGNRQRLRDNITLVKSAVMSGRLLDVGCGAGGFLAALDGFDAQGIELGPTRAEYSRQRGLNVCEAPIESPVWDEQRFDAITLWDVIEHVNDPLGMMCRAVQLLRPGGMVFMDTPTRDGFLYFFGDIAAKATRGLLLSTMGAQYAATQFGHKQIFRKRDMRRMLERAGFAAISIEEKFELSLPVDDYMRKIVPYRAVRLVANPVAATLLSILPIRNKMVVTARRP